MTATIHPFPAPVAPCPRYGAPFPGRRSWLTRRYDAARFLQLVHGGSAGLMVRWSGERIPNAFYGSYDPIRLAYEAVDVPLPLHESTYIRAPETLAVLLGEAFTAIPRASEMQTGDVMIYRDDRNPSLGYLPMLALNAWDRIGVSATGLFGEVFETDWYRNRRAMAFRLREECCPEAAS